MRFVFLILLVSCLSFFSYGEASSDTIKYFYHSKWRSESSGEIKLISNGDHFLGTSAHFSGSPGFQFYPGQQQSLTSKINFQKIYLKPKQEFFLLIIGI